MKNLFIGLLFLAACSQSASTPQTIEGLPEGIIISDYPSSELKKGVVKNGEITIEEGDILSGQRHGMWISYFPDGRIKTITSYQNGIKQGPEIQFENSGYVTSKTPYFNNKIDGEYQFYQRGKVIERKNYADGKLNGLVQKFYPKGSIMEESTYVDGIIDGEAKWYNQEGEVTIRYTYDMGELVDDGRGN